MREAVLNHTSVAADDHMTASNWLKDLAVGLALLVDRNCANRSLRALRPLEEIYCLPSYSLLDAILGLQQLGAREEYLFLCRLVTKIPLLLDVDENVVDRFRACEAEHLPPADGEPLVLCAHTGWIAVGFPSSPEWDRDQLTVDFLEIQPDTSIHEVSEQIDNLTRSIHADPISERHLRQLRSNRDPRVLWQNRQTAFPNLVFGPDVESHLVAIQKGYIEAVIQKLGALDESTARWLDQKATMPPWTCKVTPESESVTQNTRLREARRFRSFSGTSELFEWHARFGTSGRIHLRFDPTSKLVEIGYIGNHLPL